MSVTQRVLSPPRTVWQWLLFLAVLFCVCMVVFAGVSLLRGRPVSPSAAGEETQEQAQRAASRKVKDWRVPTLSVGLLGTLVLGALYAWERLRSSTGLPGDPAQQGVLSPDTALIPLMPSLEAVHASTLLPPLSSVEEGLEVQESSAISALHCAAYRGDVKRVRALLQGEGGFQVEKHLHKKVPSLRQRTPLLLACHGTSREHGEVVDLLLAAGANVQDHDADGVRGVMVAAYTGTLDIFRRLVRAGARLNCSGRAITNVLFVACVRGDEPLAEYILEEGEGAESLVNWASNEHKSTPLMGACFAGKAGLVKKLLERGASPSEVRKDKVDAMLLAVSHASDECAKEICRLLLDHGCQPNVPSCVRSSLFEAIVRQRTVCAQMLLEAGADPNFCDKLFPDWKFCCIHAAVNQCPDMVAPLLEHNADLSAVALGDLTPLHIAALRGSRELCELLLDKGADINAGPLNRPTPMMAAAELGHHDLASWMWERGGSQGWEMRVEQGEKKEKKRSKRLSGNQARVAARRRR